MSEQKKDERWKGQLPSPDLSPEAIDALYERVNASQLAEEDEHAQVWYYPPDPTWPNGCNYEAAHAEFKRITAYWPPEWVNGTAMFDKMLDAVFAAAMSTPDESTDR